MGESAGRSASAKSAPPPPITRVLDALRKLYGRPQLPERTDPFELVLWENVVYLADNARREEAFRALEEKVGLSPARILAAPRATLHEIARGGILPAERVERLREIAAIALDHFGGNLRAAAHRPVKKAIQSLRKFPGIGEPGAEKILLFSRSHPLLALDSNGLRVLLRLGYGREEKSYSASYRSVRQALGGQLRRDFDWLIEAHQLLRRHGQKLCKRSHPLCEACPLRGGCAYPRLITRVRAS